MLHSAMRFALGEDTLLAAAAMMEVNHARRAESLVRRDHLVLVPGVDHAQYGEP